MIVIPAIDIKGGKVVRLSQGEFARSTVYSGSPLEMAQRWESYGVDMIHIVDLDGALKGSPCNLDAVRAITKNVKARIELGGGIRDEKAIGDAIEAGVDKVVIGTKALDEEFLKPVVKRFGGHIVVGIDALGGVVHTRGWVFKTGITAVELARRMDDLGIATINYTDIAKDGMLEGPNIESLKSLLGAVKLDIVAAGGISRIEDIEKLKKIGHKRLKGVIVGKALYEGKLDLAEAVKICSQKE